MTDLNKIMGENLRRLRKQRGLTQEDLASALNINNPAMISKIENGKKSIGKTLLNKLCEFFYVEPYEFFITEKTPITYDDLEKRAIKLIRESKKTGILHVAEEICSYLEHRINISKKPLPETTCQDESSEPKVINK